MLRLLVEKSELWVTKKKGDSKKEKTKNEEDEPAPSAPAQSAVEVGFALFIFFVALLDACFVIYSLIKPCCYLYFVNVGKLF